MRDQLVHDEAIQSLVKFGDSLVGLLSDGLLNPDLSADERREIPLVLAGIGTPAAAQTLLDNVMSVDTTLRLKFISALNKLHRDHLDVSLDFALLETSLAAEILGHYRTYQIMEAISDPENNKDPVVEALADAQQQELERIFRLLSLLYPRVDLRSVYLGLQSKDTTPYMTAPWSSWKTS